jgi:hypothetical protein
VVTSDKELFSMNVPTAFMSYARRDDRNGALSELRKKLQAEVEEAFGNEFNSDLS